MSEQMQKIHDKIAECDREAALRGFSDTGFPRLWFSALSRVAGLELARPPRSKCVNLGDGSIPSPVTRDTSPAICELQQQNDELRAEIARLREERLTAGEREALELSLELEWPKTSEQWKALAACLGPVCLVPANKHKVAIRGLLDRQPLLPGPEGVA